MQTKLTGSKITVYYKDFSNYGSNKGIGRKDGEFIEFSNNTLILKNTQGVIEGIPLHNVIRFIERESWTQ